MKNLILISVVLMFVSCSKEEVELNRLTFEQNEIYELLESLNFDLKDKKMATWSGMEESDRMTFLRSLEFKDGRLKTGNFEYFFDYLNKKEINQFITTIMKEDEPVEAYHDYRWKNSHGCKRNNKWICIL